MTKALTYVEIDIPAFAQNSPPDSPPLMQTFRFAIDTEYLPKTIDAIPSLKDVKIDPAQISLGENLGTRATVTATFRDHRHIFAGEAFASGSFWGKFRARYGLRLRGYNLRVITGALGDALAAMETRNFIIESTDGPSLKGEYQIIAKDVLKFADGDRAQCPVLSNGFLSADIDAVVTTIVLSPSGIGNAEYPSGSPDFHIAIGGSEVCTCTARSGNTLTVVRGVRNTTAATHSAQDRVQLVQEYVAMDPSTIINDLLVNFAHVPQSYITLASWQAEISTYLNTVYTAYIAEPTSVADLISELVEQVGLAIWWNDIEQQIKLQVLHPIASTADVYDQTNYIAGSLEVTEQPEKRLTQVYTYFAKKNPLLPEDQIGNYRSTSFIVDSAAEVSYGTPVIKKIFSRWIASGGRAVADTLGQLLLARFRDPPRRIAFDVLRGSGQAPALGLGYQIGGYPFQALDGSAGMVPGQITRLNPRADIFEVEVEEISPTAIAVQSPDRHVIIIDANTNNVNLRTMHDSIYGVPSSGDTVDATINSGVTIGNTSGGTSAFNVGTWPAGVTINLTVLGRIQGAGGAGGAGSSTIGVNGSPGAAGGTALFVRRAINLSVFQIWAGGGGGGGGGYSGNSGGVPLVGGTGGSGGAGKSAGAGGAGGGGVNSGNPGNAGSLTAGGAARAPNFQEGPGGAGGGPGLAGSAGGAGTSPIHGNGGSGGAAGAAIDGISNVHYIAGSPAGADIRGGQIN